MTNFALPEWPPVLNPNQLQLLATYATTYALSHGLLYLPPIQPQPPIPSSAIHAPLALLPSPFPRGLFERARRIQSLYNVLYARIAMDVEFLDDVMGAERGVGKVDDFVGQLWTGWKAIRDEAGFVQPTQLGLFRSDYLLHSNSTDGIVTLKQVEFNTISSSFGSLSEKVAMLHRYLFATSNYYNTSSLFQLDNFPSNSTTVGLAEGLAVAHTAYGVESARILFVVQPGERNVFDQRWLEYELLKRHHIHVLRQTFDQLEHSAILDPITRALRVTHEGCESGVEISVVYFRAGYTPTDYPTPTQYRTRFLIERSRAINCPSIPLQLAGGKKIQQVLTRPGVLERFLSDRSKYGEEVYASEQLEELRSSWMKMWGLDLEADAREQLAPDLEPLGVQNARKHAANLVLKPQREGGGNNVYKSDIPAFLDALPAKDREAWIAMELITPPEGTGNYLIRAGEIHGQQKEVVRTEVISELGIFGWALFKDPKEKVEEEEVGWLVRTKGKDSNEGGVATGFSVLDSLLLVD